MPEILNLIHDPEGDGKLKPRSIAELEKKFNCVVANCAEAFSTSFLTPEKIADIKGQLTCDFEAVATDLAETNLAKNHVSALVDHLVSQGAQTEFDLLMMGASEFADISRNTLGPLWASYVNTVFSSGEGNEVFLFAARDATPMYWTARGLINSNRGCYNLQNSQIVHVDWNRWFMGQEDETQADKRAHDLNHPDMRMFYQQMGFGNGKKVKIVEPGAWGSAAAALKKNLPEQDFELWFVFSHMPQRIFGFLNENASKIDPEIFEMINDTQEAVPKAYTRPEKLVRQNGRVFPDISCQLLRSPYMQAWSLASHIGAYQAGIDFAQGKQIGIKDQVASLMHLSAKARQGQWTGVLPDHTPTWDKGAEWEANWPYGKIPPLR